MKSAGGVQVILLPPGTWAVEVGTYHPGSPFLDGRVTETAICVARWRHLHVGQSVSHPDVSSE